VRASSIVQIKWLTGVNGLVVSAEKIDVIHALNFRNGDRDNIDRDGTAGTDRSGLLERQKRKEKEWVWANICFLGSCHASSAFSGPVETILNF